MANASVWAQPEKDSQTLQQFAMQPEPGPSVWAPVGNQPATPDLSAVSRPQPNVQVFKPSPLQQQIANDQQRLQKVQFEQQNPWGTAQNHPGKLGKLAHVFSEIGNIAGDIFAPSTMALIPGTQLNREVQEGGLAKRLNMEQAEQSENEARGAQTAKTQVETAEMPEDLSLREQGENAKEQLQDAQILNLLHPQAKTDFEAWRQQNPNAPVNDWLMAQSQARQAGEAPKTQQIKGPDGQDHVMEWNPQTRKFDIDTGIAGQKPPQVTVGSQEAGVDRLGSRLGKPYQTASDASQHTLDRIDLTNRNVDAGYVGQGLAIPELLTSLVSGQGTGVRVTQPELNSITSARGIKGDAESWFNQLAGKGKLTDQDKAQIKNVLNDARNRILQKQQIVSGALDSINGAESRNQVQQADKTARQQLTELEKYGHYSGEQVQLKNGQTVTIKGIHPDGSIEY